MSIYRIDGHVMPVTELLVWVENFISLVHQKYIDRAQVPDALYAAIENQTGKEAADAVLQYLGTNEEYIGKILDSVRAVAPQLAMEKNRRYENPTE